MKIKHCSIFTENNLKQLNAILILANRNRRQPKNSPLLARTVSYLLAQCKSNQLNGLSIDFNQLSNIAALYPSLRIIAVESSSPTLFNRKKSNDDDAPYVSLSDLLRLYQRNKWLNWSLTNCVCVWFCIFFVCHLHEVRVSLLTFLGSIARSFFSSV